MTGAGAVLRIVFGALAAALSFAGPARADPDALWHIVHDKCVPHEAAQHDPTPCALVDLEAGYVVLKDRVGATQFLVLPTARISGIESAALLAPDAPNYMKDAWRARSFVAARAAKPLPRQDLSLAVNSIDARSQNQLHIHVDCVKAAVRDALAKAGDAIGDRWAPFPEPLEGHRYIARRVLSADLDGINPFLLLARSSPAARHDMGEYTLVLVGARFGDAPGFMLLADRADPARGDLGGGEALQDHACAVARR